MIELGELLYGDWWNEFTDQEKHETYVHIEGYFGEPWGTAFIVWDNISTKGVKRLT